jgi:hypothetical protein
MIVLVLFAVTVVLAEIYPYHPATATGWGVLALLALPLVMAGEYFGERVLGAPFVTRFSRTARIVYGVIVFVAVIACGMFALQFLNGHLVTWSA